MKRIHGMRAFACSVIVELAIFALVPAFAQTPRLVTVGQIVGVNKKAKSFEIKHQPNIHDYSEREIAALLGLSRSAVAIRLFRARRRLKKMMGEATEEAS